MSKTKKLTRARKREAELLKSLSEAQEKQRAAVKKWQEAQRDLDEANLCLRMVCEFSQNHLNKLHPVNSIVGAKAKERDCPAVPVVNVPLFGRNGVGARALNVLRLAVDEDKNIINGKEKFQTKVMLSYGRDCDAIFAISSEDFLNMTPDFVKNLISEKLLEFVRAKIKERQGWCGAEHKGKIWTRK